MALWTAHPDCPAHTKTDLEARVRSFPPSFLLAPAAGEVFDNADTCQERLQGWALSQGFAIVRTSGTANGTRVRFQFACIHYGSDTANKRQLEKHVERDEDDNIISRRKQEGTSIHARACPYLITLTRRQIPRRGSGVFGLALGIQNENHSHTMAPNPFVYRKEHVKALPGYVPAVELARSLRIANISYSKALRVLDQAHFPLDRSTYYNIRHRPFSANQDEFSGLIAALEEEGFIFECRIEEELDINNQVISQQLQQIWFSHPNQIQLAQRFSADFALWIDGTFQTNTLNLVLIVTAGTTNCGSTFVSSLSFARSEAKLSFDFIFNCLKKRIFCPPVPPPRVIISDQAGGLISSLPISLPSAILQFCDWHVVENMKKRLADKGYPKAFRKEIHSLLWKFVKSDTEVEVESNRREIHAKLRPQEVNYLEEFWRPKERQFLRVYTRKYPNLGAFSNQRSESIHPVTKQILHKHLSLEEASRRLGETLQSKFRELAAEEAESGSKLPRTLDQGPFRYLSDTITFYAINKISSEWEDTKKGLSDGTLRPTTSPCSTCELLIRFGLPCRHYLVAPCHDGIPIPRSLFHPRWWINGEKIQIATWTPSYRTFALPLSPPRPGPAPPIAPPISPRRNEFTRRGLQTLEARDGLQGYARHRYDIANTIAQQNLLNFAQELERDDLHTRMPDSVKTSGWNRRKKVHGRANQRLLTGAEAAERDADSREARANRDALQALPGAIDFEEEAENERAEAEAEAEAARAEAEAEAAESEVETEAEAEAEAETEAEANQFAPANLPPSATAPARLQPLATYSRAGRKRTATLRALESEKAPKRGQGRG